ncbi:MAG: U32 family peptidase, partial [Erysipelotrichaceae bacterium]|nr:U32 family peptidase [Erysipelotrichaceae bacterium]
MDKIELLAPAGNMECLKAAIHNGADAIYIGGSNFSARAYADNFTNEQIVEAIKYAHIYGVKIYVSVNITIYDDEINDVIDFIDFLYLNDVDALIVSDLGLIDIIKKRYKDLDIHVSTQLNTHCLWQIKMLEELNVSRVVLARECSLSTIKHIKANSSLELEIFTHGSLCVCYSGNCLHSSLIGKRSGNRGKCAQPCRMEYSLANNNQIVAKKAYLLSTKDLNTLEHIDEIIKSGVTSLKIEGRMKSAEYVAFVVKSYRNAIDHYYDNNVEINKDASLEMKLIYSRDFTSGYLFNEKNKNITNTFRPSHIGILVGEIINVYKDKVQIKLSKELKQKDKIIIISSRFEDIKLYVNKIFVKNKLVPKGYEREIIEIPLSSKVDKNAKVYKMEDYDLLSQIKETYLNNLKKIPIKMKLIANVNENMVLSVKDYHNHSILVKSNYVIEKAINSITSNEKIIEQLSKLSSTPYALEKITILSDQKGIIPLKYINELRREAIDKLNKLRSTCYIREKSNIMPYFNYLIPNKNK